MSTHHMTADEYQARIANKEKRRAAVRKGDALQVQVADFLREAAPDELKWFHVPNGGKRGKLQAAILKRMGVQPGVPDYLLFWVGHHKSFAWECKAGSASLSSDQRGWRNSLEAHAFQYSEIRSAQEAQDILLAAGVPLRKTFSRNGNLREVIA